MDWERATGSYSNKTDQEIDDWRTDKIQDWEDLNLTGTMIVGEGNTWVELEGDEDDVQMAMHSLEGDSFLDSCNVIDSGSYSSRRLSKIYTYDEDRQPLTSDDV